SLSGCVPSTAYEQAVSTAEVEREGHRRAAEELMRAEGELKQVRTERAQLLAERNQLLSRLQSEETRAAQASLDVQNGEKATEQQQELVTQLRGELARVGENIKVYEGERSDLKTELQTTAAALAEKDKRISALQAEVAGLKARAEQSAATQDQLSGALDELTSLQEQVADGQEEQSEEEQGQDVSDPQVEEKENPEAIHPADHDVSD